MGDEERGQRLGILRRDDHDHAETAIEDTRHLATPPVRISQPNTGGSGQVLASKCAASPSGSTRGTFSTSPPPVMWASALTLPVRAAARQLLT
jgi:hypothetical protein